MVYLWIIKTSIKQCNAIDDNVIMANPGETSLHNFKQIKIFKSDLKYYTFNITYSESIYKGDISLPESMRKRYRFHLNHKYWVEGYQSLPVPKNTIFDVSKIGILGQDEAINEIMWSIFEPRKLSFKTRVALNLQLVRGIILYGPPGTGKASMIRGICNYQGIVPNVIHGPELLNQFTGNSEANIRALFLKPMAEQKFNSDSPLHVIVLDEMDSLFPKRATRSGDTNTTNTVVSQMLSMMDGYTPFENYVIFGTTNRLDMIDPALLRSGRFELHIKIDVPNTQGRLDILNFLTKPLQTSGRLASNVNETLLSQIAVSAVNYSGAELKQLVQYASRSAIKRSITSSETDLNWTRHIDETKIVVWPSDIIHAYQILNSRRCLTANKEIGGTD